MQSTMTAQLVCDALTMALVRRGFPKGVIVHSDRGSQHCSKAYRKLIHNYPDIRGESVFTFDQNMHKYSYP